VFNRNGYRTRLFDRCVRVFFDIGFQLTQSCSSFGATELESYVLLSPIHWFTFSANSYSNLSTLFVSVSPSEYKICLSPNSTPLSPFYLNKIPKGKLGSKILCIVYHFKCRCCSASYVGRTTSHLHTRVSEHLGISALTGNKSSNPKLTSILQHLNNTGHTASLDDFKILSSCPSSDELMIHESLLISKLKPTLNVQGSSVPLLLL
jgi:hypothetical protein